MDGKINNEASLTKGEAIKKANVTPKGMPALTKPINKGIDDQEQKGVITPSKAAKR